MSCGEDLEKRLVQNSLVPSSTFADFIIIPFRMSCVMLLLSVLQPFCTSLYMYLLFAQSGAGSVACLLALYVIAFGGVMHSLFVQSPQFVMKVKI